MLWYKSWLDTRWRFLTGLALLTCVAAVTVWAYPEVLKLLPLAAGVGTDTDLGRRISEAANLARSFRGYEWTQWFRQNMTELGTLFALLLGVGGPYSQTPGGGALFTLSLPVSRRAMLSVRAATGLTELFILASVPSLIIPLLAPAVGASYAIGDVLIHGVCVFLAAAVFFSLAFLLSTMFDDLWRPLLIAFCVAIALGLAGEVFRDFADFDIFRVMNGEVYFRTGALPWAGLLVSAAAASAMLYASVINIERRDF